MATVNTELLRQTLEHIENYPETWNQGAWCGTSQCFAGWAVTLAGMQADPELDNVAVDDMPEDLASAVDPDVEYVTVREAAIIALGIADATLADDGTDGDGSILGADAVLFYAGNTMADLRHFVAELCGETATAAS